MAKIKMICPFSGELCKECPVYRGRHYYLCFCQKYRGHMEEEDKFTKFSRHGITSNRKFEMPSFPLDTKFPNVDPLQNIFKRHK